MPDQPTPLQLPDLALIPDRIVERLRAFPDLAPLTRTDPDGTTVSAIVGTNNADLVSQIKLASAALCVAVAVFVDRAVPMGEIRSREVFFEQVDLTVEIAELVESNQTTPASEPPGVGTGMSAWHIAERVFAALVNWTVAGLSEPYKIYARGNGLENATTLEDAESGQKVVRVLLTTSCRGVERAD